MRFVSVVTSTRSPFAATVARLAQQVVDLPLDRAHLDHRIDQSRRPDDLLDDHAARFLQLVGPWRRADEHDLLDPTLPLRKRQRPVVERRRQAEAVLDQHFLAGPVARVHAADLRHRLVAFIDDQDGVLRQVVQQRRRRLAGRPPGEVPRVVLDAVAVADLADHLEVEHRALVQALRFQHAPRALEVGQPLRRAPP